MVGYSSEAVTGRSSGMRTWLIKSAQEKTRRVVSTNAVLHLYYQNRAASFARFLWLVLWKSKGSMIRRWGRSLLPFDVGEDEWMNIPSRQTSEPIDGNSFQKKQKNSSVASPLVPKSSRWLMGNLVCSYWLMGNLVTCEVSPITLLVPPWGIESNRIDLGERITIDSDSFLCSFKNQILVLLSV